MRPGLGVFALAAVLVSAGALSPSSAQQAEVRNEGALVQTAGKKTKAKASKATSYKSCGTFMYRDRKSGQCTDGRVKPAPKS